VIDEDGLEPVAADNNPDVMYFILRKKMLHTCLPLHRGEENEFPSLNYSIARVTEFDFSLFVPFAAEY
jgi:hypothetical protein